MKRIPVEELEVGDRVDLESCPYLSGHPMALFELATVCHVERETPQCVAIGYEGIDVVGYRVGTTLRVERRNRT